jgi:hypothetical protein
MYTHGITDIPTLNGPARTSAVLEDSPPFIRLLFEGCLHLSMDTHAADDGSLCVNDRSRDDVLWAMAPLRASNCSTRFMPLLPTGPASKCICNPY